MAVVARTRRRDHILSGRGTLMAQCLAEGLPVASACSGRGACGKCVLTILQGLERLPPPDPHERDVLERNGAEPSQRLGCQCVTGPATGPLLLTTGYW